MKAFLVIIDAPSLQMILNIQEGTDASGYEVTVGQIGPRSATPQDFVAALPTKDACYAVYDYEFTLEDGRPKSKLYFFVWAHHRSNPHSKMLYTSQKSVLVNALEGIEECILKSEEEALVALGAAEEEGEEAEWDPDDD